MCYEIAMKLFAVSIIAIWFNPVAYVLILCGGAVGVVIGALED